MSGMNRRERQLLKVQEAGFMVDDLRLFLNTHPQSQVALDALQKYLRKEREARAEYEADYGPLTLQAMEGRSQYDWHCHIWPRELEV